MRKVADVAPNDDFLDLLPRWLVVLVIAVVMAMWAASIVYSAINPDWPVPASVHGALIAVVTGVMGILAVKKR